MAFESTGSGEGKPTYFPTVRVLICDLNEAEWNEEEHLYLTRYGKVKRVCLIGTIVEKRDVIDNNKDDIFQEDKSNSRLSFKLDDGTGQIWGTLWGASPQDYPEIGVGKTVMVLGFIRAYKNHPSMNIDSIIKLKDHNLETLHLLRILKKRKLEPRFQFEKRVKADLDTDFFAEPPKKTAATKNFEEDDLLGQLEQTDNSSPVMNGHYEDDFGEFESHSVPKPPAATVSVESQPSSTHEKKVPSPSPNKFNLEDQISTFIGEKDQGDGVSKKDIAAHLNLSENELQPILDQLIQDLKIYKLRPGFYGLY